jgi:hypothetical protein
MPIMHILKAIMLWNMPGTHAIVPVWLLVWKFGQAQYLAIVIILFACLEFWLTHTLLDSPKFLTCPNSSHAHYWAQWHVPPHIP